MSLRSYNRPKSLVGWQCSWLGIHDVYVNSSIVEEGALVPGDKIKLKLKIKKKTFKIEGRSVSNRLCHTNVESTMLSF